MMGHGHLLCDQLFIHISASKSSPVCRFFLNLVQLSKFIVFLMEMKLLFKS